MYTIRARIADTNIAVLTMSSGTDADATVLTNHDTGTEKHRYSRYAYNIPPEKLRNVISRKY